MDWRAYLASLLEAIERVPAPKWLGVVAIGAAALLLAALILAWVRNFRLRYRLAEHEERANVQAPPLPGVASPAPTPDDVKRPFIDRIFPRRPRTLLTLVAAIALASWVAGIYLANDKAAFLGESEWQAQPLYLAVHIIAIRMFFAAFVRHFTAGTRHLQMSPENAGRLMRFIVGPLGALIAFAVALPFCIYDYYQSYLLKTATADGLGAGADRLLLGLWCIEWFLTAFIWVMLVGFAVLTHWAIGRHDFRDPIAVVLHDRQYRPFLQMSARGATIVLGFWVANVLYVLYTGGLASDYLGVAISLGLLLVGFGPPLWHLRRKVKRAVDRELASLRGRLGAALTRDRLNPPAGAPASAHGIDAYVDEVLVTQRISYLEQLYSNLGHSEAMDILIKLVVPVATVTWYLIKYTKGLS
jgi:hypothetical protein